MNPIQKDVLSDEQIIAAAGEPVAHVVKDDEGEQLMYPAAIFKYKMASEDDIICDLYTADAILAAVKPLLERIAELEANASTMKAYYEQVFEDGGKRSAELTKQRDDLLKALEEITDAAGQWVHHSEALRLGHFRARVATSSINGAA